MLHVYNLRGTDGGIRADTSEQLESMAQYRYKCSLLLSIAHGSIDDNAHSERTFSSLQSARNRAQKVIRLLNGSGASCLPINPDPVDPAPFIDRCLGVAEYRNYAH
jgi:hypothetical protein